MKPTLIAIAGGTASGKSSFAELLLARLHDKGAQLIRLDNYYLPQDHKSLEERALNNYDHPDALEFDLLFEHLGRLRYGETVEMPLYDFALHTRRKETQEIEASPLLLLDGFLILHDPRIRELCTHKIFVQASDETRFTRRLERDVRERGRTLESVVEQWKNTVQPMFLEFVAPTKNFADRVVENEELGMEELERGVEKLACSLLSSIG